ncbi:MAG TPA: glutamyl-tRNA reductase [Actinomycetota bacterium]|nr:glutamyl-tRNA reductase [Actinomycetota bacterium]
MILALCAGRSAPPELRARLAYDEPTQRALLQAERPGVGELAILCTCHRTEAYLTSAGAESEAIHGLAAILPGLLPTDQNDLQILEGLEAIEHLFRVSCGLDSQVLGEPQVLGQVRRAFVLAKEVGSTGPALSNIFGRAMRLGKRVRSETELGRAGHSIGSIAAHHVQERLGSLEGRSGAIVGAGEAAEDAALRLHALGARLAVVSRQKGSAARLAETIDGTPFALTELAEVMGKSDFAVVAVSGGIVVRPRHIPERQADDRFLILDLSVPRAVDVDGRTDVELRSLEEIPGPRNPEVAGGQEAAEALLAAEMAQMERWLETRASGPAIQRLRSQAEAVVADEVARAAAGLDAEDPARARLATLGTRIANKLLHGPTAALRDSDSETRTAIMRLFGLD